MRLLCWLRIHRWMDMGVLLGRKHHAHLIYCTQCGAERVEAHR